ncbi:hypothetical protein CDV36_011190 [Fusarium kuroshium]|uniref:Aminoglycoside phosphotransferase domain-containing protein n=1 Tax=Fusarium kuroshium TaxID=2010991 RepID=A0A3M2RV96_9HYPO|nr:hypothetical protein CDV36_011190 [Fusarium kuroshium]
MRNEIIESQIKRAREAFIQDIWDTKEQVICDLASSYYGGMPCHIFTITHGSFNICVCVQFDDPLGTSPCRWVIRIPFPGRVPWIDEKIDSEVATMKYVAEKTTIPIPKVHAWSYEAESPIGHAFIMMDYIQGVPLSALNFKMTEKWGHTRDGGRMPALARVHDQLADLFIQLRSLEFSEIGALGMPTPESPGITIRHRPLPVEVALQEIERLNPTVFFPEKTTFKTGHEYINALIKLGRNRLFKTKNLGVDSREAASEVVYAYHEFYADQGPLWVRKLCSIDIDKGPFVLMHGDMALHGSNLLWDEKLNLVAVIDWEWCHTVPVSCFIPPAWLTGFFPNPIRQMCLFRISHRSEMIGLCESIADRSKACFPQSSLAHEWNHLPLEPFLMVVLPMLYPETIDDIFWDFMMHKIFVPPQSQVVEKRMEKFLENIEVQGFIDRKMAQQEEYDKAYQAYIEEHGESLDCHCQNCQREEQNFNVLRELPRLSPPSSSG